MRTVAGDKRSFSFSTQAITILSGTSPRTEMNLDMYHQELTTPTSPAPAPNLSWQMAATRQKCYCLFSPMTYGGPPLRQMTIFVNW